MTEITTSSRKWRAVLTFYAETPTDDDEADALADRITDILTRTVNELSFVTEGSVSVPDLDTVRD